MTGKNYSQNDEQDFILKFFDGKSGRFLDIGAFDGITFSNTRALAESGWAGLMVEPSPFNLCKAIDSIREFEGRVEILACAVSDCDGVVKLKTTTEPSRMWAATISPDAPSNYISEKQSASLLVPAVRMNFLSSYGPFDFISLDAEYMDFQILRDSVDHLGDCKLLSIEPRNIDERAEMIPFLAGIGFSVYHQTNENLIVFNTAH